MSARAALRLPRRHNQFDARGINRLTRSDVTRDQPGRAAQTARSAPPAPADRTRGTRCGHLPAPGTDRPAHDQSRLSAPSGAGPARHTARPDPPPSPAAASRTRTRAHTTDETGASPEPVAHPTDWAHLTMRSKGRKRRSPTLTGETVKVVR